MSPSQLQEGQATEPRTNGGVRIFFQKEYGSIDLVIRPAASQHQEGTEEAALECTVIRLDAGTADAVWTAVCAAIPA